MLLRRLSCIIVLSALAQVSDAAAQTAPAPARPAAKEDPVQLSVFEVTTSKDIGCIRYEDGGEELYDHANGPHEWSNLAGKPEFAAVKADLAKSLPKSDAAPAGTKKNRERD
jgi:hypothetical protein